MIGERVGWDLDRKDKPEVAKRVDFLLQFFQKKRVAVALEAICGTPSIDHVTPSVAMAIEDLN